MQVSNSQTTVAVRRLSYAQMYALHIGTYYKLLRSSMGWWAENHRDNQPIKGVPRVSIIAPSTIKSLWRMGLLDGIHDIGAAEGRPELRTNKRGQRLMAEIMHDTGLYFDPHTDELVHVPDYTPCGATIQ
jgi:hypothetical protein